MTDWGKLIIAVGLRVEDFAESVVAALARLRGRRHPVIVPFIGHGTTRRVRVGARLVLGREAAAPSVLATASGEGPATPRSRRAVLRASIARFLTIEVPGAEVTIHLPGGDVVVRTDRDGYVDHEVELTDVAPGWLEVGLTGPAGSTATARVLVTDPDARIGLVSDVDDTIVDTGITRGLDFLRVTLLTDVQDRTPLPGAAALYRALVTTPAGEPARPVFYVSTSPWNLHEMLLQFVGLRGFPLGPLLLTDWGPSHTGLFRIGAQAHKLGLVRRLLDEHPHLRLILIGDSGQEDPEIYATLARATPDRVAAVYIRRTTGADPVRLRQVDDLAAEITAAGVPMLAVDDSAQIAVHAATLGLLDRAAVASVRAELAR
ncbi:App1 family protein [Pseudonocardia xinjiangensis]|uniref:App1 family protein n=1 Tax=Pseudonocardia xinjiangensis TaxID=75289 RepID=UPI003D8AD481